MEDFTQDKIIHVFDCETWETIGAVRYHAKTGDWRAEFRDGRVRWHYSAKAALGWLFGVKIRFSLARPYMTASPNACAWDYGVVDLAPIGWRVNLKDCWQSPIPLEPAI